LICNVEQEDVILSIGTHKLQLSFSCPLHDFKWDDISMVALPDRFIRGTLGKDDLYCLKYVYGALYPSLDLTSSIKAHIIRKYRTIDLGVDTYGSKLSCRSLKCARIRASCATANGMVNLSGLNIRPGYVDQYLSHEIKIAMHGSDMCLLL
jgi:hypothetical protein